MDELTKNKIAAESAAQMPPASMPQASTEPAQPSEEPSLSDAPTKTALSGNGFLIVRVTTALGAVPLQGASVLIRNNIAEGERAGDVIRSLITDRNGMTQTVSLPAPPTASSFVPGSKEASAFYGIDVTYPGYDKQLFSGVPIFDGITSVQNVDLIPLPQNGYPDNRSKDDTRTFEGLNPAL